MFKMILICALCLFGAWAAGVRLHLDAVLDLFEGNSAPKAYRKIDLKSGTSLVGEILHEDANSVRVKVDGGSFTFSRGEIAALTEMDSNSLPQGEFANSLFAVQPIFTFRPEDRIFAKKKTRKAAGTARAPVPPQSAGLALPAYAQAALAQAEQYRSVAQQKQREMEAAIREMEEGY